MKNFLLLFLLNILALCFSQTVIADQSHITRLKEMFDKVTVAKDARVIPTYYDKDFKLYSNGKIMNFAAFLKIHRDIYKTSVQYKIRYDDNTFVEQGNRVAGRLFITIKKPDERAQEIEVIFIAEYKNDKLYRLWEITYPEWSKLKAFQKKS